ncbi:MAG: hypothetical protein ABI574_04575, partial [Burkholderiales bacterium]
TWAMALFQAAAGRHKSPDQRPKGARPGGSPKPTTSSWTSQVSLLGAVLVLPTPPTQTGDQHKTCCYLSALIVSCDVTYSYQPGGEMTSVTTHPTSQLKHSIAAAQPAAKKPALPAGHHTGPLQLNHGDQTQLCDCDGEVRGFAPVAKTLGERWERAANARRLVACWNACIGLSTGDLEALAKGPRAVDDSDITTEATVIKRTGFDLVVEYRIDAGSPGSSDEPPTADDVEITGLYISATSKKHNILDLFCDPPQWVVDAAEEHARQSATGARRSSRRSSRRIGCGLRR